jgi:hypothetical protein
VWNDGSAVGYNNWAVWHPVAAGITGYVVKSATIKWYDAYFSTVQAKCICSGNTCPNTADVSISPASTLLSFSTDTVTLTIPSPLTVALCQSPTMFTITQSTATNEVRTTEFSVNVAAPLCSAFTWKPPTGNPTSILKNTVHTWTVADDLEDDTTGVSWSTLPSLGTARITLTTTHTFITLSGNIVTFNPTESGVFAYTIT